MRNIAVERRVMAMRANGKTYAAIGEHLALSRQRVHAIVRRRLHEQGTSTAEYNAKAAAKRSARNAGDDARVLSLCKSGASQRKIAKTMHRSVKWVKATMQHLSAERGLDLGYRRVRSTSYTAEEAMTYRRCYDAGDTYQQIAALFAVSRQRVYRVLQRFS